MAYENIDAARLKASISSCRNAIKYTDGKEFISRANNIWVGDAKNKLISSLNTLYDVRFRDLNNKLNNYYTVACYIEQYKNTQGQINSLNGDIARLNTKLWREEKKEEEETFWYEDNKGKWHEGKRIKETKITVKDTNVENQINSKKSEILAKERTLSSLEGQINGLI